MLVNKLDSVFFIHFHRPFLSYSFWESITHTLSFLSLLKSHKHVPISLLNTLIFIFLCFGSLVICALFGLLAVRKIFELVCWVLYVPDGYLNIADGIDTCECDACSGIFLYLRSILVQCSNFCRGGRRCALTVICACALSFLAHEGFVVLSV